MRDCDEQQSEKWEGDKVQSFHSFFFSGKMKRENCGKVEKIKGYLTKCVLEEENGVWYL